MSKTKDWIIAKQQEQADTAYLEDCPQPTEQEQLQIDLDNFNRAADQIENSIDNYLNKQSAHQEWEVSDDAYENYVDNCLSWGEDYR